jgi:membrane protein
MFAYFLKSVSWTEIVKRTVRETIKDDAPSLAAQLAYYFFLALFPALLGLIALASLFPLENFTDDVIRFLSPFAPNEVITIVRDQMLRIAHGNHSGLLSIGVLGALWSSSSATTAAIDVMNRAYGIQETRGWFRVRLTSILLTTGLALFILLSLTLVLAGPQMADYIGRLGAGQFFAWTWKVLQWPIVFALVTVGIGLLYYFGPDTEQEWVWITPGSMLAATLWMLGSLGFRAYVVYAGNYEATYGTIGGIIVLMLWFYVMGLVIVIGAELNAEIEHAAPWGAGARADVKIRKRPKVGLAASRDYARTHPPNGLPATD